MSLTQEQKEIRRTGVGASEIAMVAEIHPYRGPLDVWITKPTASRPPLLDELAEDEDENPRMEVGTALEDGLRALYTKRTGISLIAPKVTLRHPQHPTVLASPDGIALKDDGAVGNGGLELKVVGARMLHHWEDGVPDYVLAQAAQNMAVLDKEWWDVGALLGGTDFRVWRVQRDLQFEASLIESALMFWEAHVLADSAPEPRDPEEAKRLLRERYPGSTATKARVVGDGADGEIAELVRWYRAACAQIGTLEHAKAQLEIALCALVGADYGIEGSWGKFIWFPRRGNVAWKEVAQELGGGVVPVEIAEKHRGSACRVPKFTAPSEGRSNGKKKR